MFNQKMTPRVFGAIASAALLAASVSAMAASYDDNEKSYGTNGASAVGDTNPSSGAIINGDPSSSSSSYSTATDQYASAQHSPGVPNYIKSNGIPNKAEFNSLSDQDKKDVLWQRDVDASDGSRVGNIFARPEDQQMPR